MKKYLIVFHSGSYKTVDAEVDTYDQALETKNELEAQMWNSGERDFYYSIEEVNDSVDDDILDDDDFDLLIGRY